MSPVLAGLGLIILGLVGAFFGYRIFRVLLPIYAGAAGFLLAWGWWGQNAWLLALIVGVVLAVVFAVLAYAFWSTMVAFGGLIMGGAIGIVIGTSLNLWGWLTVLLAIGLGIVFAALFFWVRNEMVIISTATTGGTLVARGVGEFFGWRSGLEGVINANPAWLSILVLTVGIVAFIAGLLYQWRMYAKLRWYDARVAHDAAKVSQAAAGTAQSYTTRAAANIDAAAGVAGSSVLGSGTAIAGAAAAAAAATTMTATDVAAQPTDTAANVASSTRAAVVDISGNTGEAVSDAVDVPSEMVGGAEDAVTDFAVDVEVGAGGAVDAAEEPLADAGSAGAEIAGDIPHGSADALDATGDKAVEVKDSLAGAASGAGETAADVAADANDGLAGALTAGAEDAASDAGEAVAGTAVDAKDASADAGAVVANKVEDVVESAAKSLDIDLDENKVAKVLADLEKSFEGLEESAKFKEALEFVEGIGSVFAEKLKEIGVNNVLDLLRHGATREGRLELAEKSGIAGKQILEWVNHADLYRIKGVGSEFADLLEAAGVDTVPELAQRNPVKLLEKILATNEEKRLVRRAPHPSDVEDWVSQAKSLPRIIQY